MSARSIRRARERDLGRARRRLRRSGVAAGVALGAAGLAAGQAEAANFPVTNLNDFGAGSLRAAITSANMAAGPDTVSFSGAATSGEITLTSGPLEIYDDLAINGPGTQLSISGDTNANNAPDFATADGAQGDHRIFTINDPAAPGAPLQQVSISGLTLKEGVADLFVTGPPYGPFFAQSGGAIYSRGTALSVSGVNFVDNVATNYGGAIYLTQNNDKGRLTVTGSTFTGNRARSGGGAIESRPSKYDSNEPEIGTTITNTQITGNRAGGTNFGGFGFDSDPSGGGISGKYEVVVSGTTISSNTAATINAGFTGGSGGAAELRGGGTIEDSVLADNYAGERAGGALIQGVKLRSSTVSGNSAGDFGGGLVAAAKYQTGPARIDNSTISGNSVTGAGAADGDGGGIAAYGAGDGEAVVVRNSTVANNSAAARGGGILSSGYGDQGSFVRLKSTIVADNTAAGAANDLQGTFFNGTESVDDPDSMSAGFSLIESPGTAVPIGDPGGSNLIGVDPKLSPLAENGGPTRTQALAPTSPAVDAAQAYGLTADQRGQARTLDAAATNAPLSDGTDMGAFELGDAAASGDDPDTAFAKKPKKKLKLKQGKKTKKLKVKFTGTDNAPPSGPLTFECKVDKGAFDECKSPLKLKLGKGKHTIAVRAIDEGGQVDATPAEAKVKVKKAKPKK